MLRAGFKAIYLHYSQCADCKKFTEVLTVKGSAVEMLECMLEQTSHQTSVVVDGVLSSLDRSALLKTMVYFHEMQSNPLVKTVQMDDDAERGMFRAYHTHVILEDNSNEEEKRGTADVRLKVCEVYIQIVASLCMRESVCVTVV